MRLFRSGSYKCLLRLEFVSLLTGTDAFYAETDTSRTRGNFLVALDDWTSEFESYGVIRDIC